MITDPVRQFKELFKTHLFFWNRSKNDRVMMLQRRDKLPHAHFSAPSKMMSSTEIDVTPKWLKIAKFWLQILIGNTKSYSKRTYFFKIEENMIKLRRSKVGSNLNSKIVPCQCKLVLTKGLGSFICPLTTVSWIDLPKQGQGSERLIATTYVNKIKAVWHKVNQFSICGANWCEHLWTHHRLIDGVSHSWLVLSNRQTAYLLQITRIWWIFQWLNQKSKSKRVKKMQKSLTKIS